jgi:hypothetical protein
MSYYIMFIVYFVYCVINNWMSVAMHGHELSTNDEKIINKILYRL